MIELKSTNTIAYFSDYFGIAPEELDEYGALNISILNDLPFFIDPFLLFNSTNAEYRGLHDRIIDYLRFLRDKSLTGSLDTSAISSWYTFKEVKQTWLGFSLEGNSGRGLGKGFANSLYNNLHRIFTDFGEETISNGSHIEKLCLFRDGVGRDNISDFTTNLIKEHLLDFTEGFAAKHVHSSLLKSVRVSKVRFNYTTETWESVVYKLPFVAENNDYVILTPKDILTMDDTWINRSDLIQDFSDVAASIADDELRFQVNNYFAKVLPDDPETAEKKEAVSKTILEFPEILDYFIKYKEDNGNLAQDISSEKIRISSEFYITQFKSLIELLSASTDFYGTLANSYHEAYARVQFLKDVIENQDGYRYLWKDGRPITRESDVHILYRLTWFATKYDVNREVNNGRGPVDFKISMGRADKSLVEFKLAKNSKLKQNLEKQVEIYQKANDTKSKLKVIFYFSYEEKEKIDKILKELQLEEDPDIILIDARDDNKPSASNA